MQRITTEPLKKDRLERPLFFRVFRPLPNKNVSLWLCISAERNNAKIGYPDDDRRDFASGSSRKLYGDAGRPTGTGEDDGKPPVKPSDVSRESETRTNPGTGQCIRFANRFNERTAPPSSSRSPSRRRCCPLFWTARC